MLQNCTFLVTIEIEILILKEIKNLKESKIHEKETTNPTTTLIISPIYKIEILLLLITNSSFRTK